MVSECFRAADAYWLPRHFLTAVESVPKWRSLFVRRALRDSDFKLNVGVITSTEGPDVFANRSYVVIFCM